MNRFTCMIVEDEPVSQEILKRYIADCPQLDLVAVCSNGIEANEALRQQPVDVIFLDITMPRMSGLDFYRALTDPPSVIFTTAYPEYAVNGFELNAIDYLVKPFPFERFLKAVNKLSDIASSSPTDPGFIFLPADKRMHKINLNEILFMEGMGDYVKVIIGDKTLIVHNTLQKLQEQLPPRLFVRVHKSYVIALNHINYIEGNTVIVGKHEIPIGQTYRADFLSSLQKGNGR